MTTRPPRPADRLRMLWHLGAVRAVQGDRSFGICVEHGWAAPQCVEPGRVLYRLTERGRTMAQSQAGLGWPLCQ
jgi:hypothetical protein